MAAQANQPLPEGHQLQNYRILRVLASGGFSFVYLAHDENDAPVAIKEFLPASLALRTGGAIEPKVPEEQAAAFRYGMKCFFEEGKALASLTHPNVVRVLNFFRANETVYLVMRYERGRTLQEHIFARRGALRESWIRSTFAALLNGLREVHTNKLLHLDIKPGNVYLRSDGTPLLIDFGAARQMLQGEAPSLPPMYTPGFASPEHHMDRAKLGPWSDIYSVGATMYACVTASAPPSAEERREKDRMTSARKAGAGRYSSELLDTIDWCMRLEHLERPQSGFTLQKTLLGEKEPEYRGAAPVLEQIRDMWTKFSGR
ncbi:MAG TPA: serine/threonine-protein kinase [Burkholderiales bacterium]